MSERTLILIKPDAVRRGLIGQILYRFETKGLHVRGMKMIRFDADLARRHYAEHVDKPFYPRLEKFITSGPSVALVIEGDDVIVLARKMVGATDRLEAAPGTIRGDHAFASTEQNLVHASDSPASGIRESAIFFTDAELY